MRHSLPKIAFGVLFGLLAGGILFLTSRSPRGSMILLSPPPTPRSWVIHISGAVESPGVYKLPAGSRVRDAVEAAGGLSADASPTINLAALLKDGQLVFIPSNTSSGTTSERNNSLTITLEPLPTQQAPVLGEININTASAEELDELPDIGPVIAQRIIDYRAANGPFNTIEEIMNVPGIGQVTFDKVKSMISTGP